MALFQHWNQSRFQSSIQIVRDEMMRLAKISSKATYHRAMAYLHKSRYINYTPSYNPYLGSKIEFFPEHTASNTMQLNKKNEPVHILTTTLINEPINKLYSNTIINHNSITTRELLGENSKKTNSHVFEKEKTSAKKEKDIPPHIHSVEEHFVGNNSTLIEAQKFYNHYRANGWLIGGKTPMKDWKASANKWIANSPNFKSPHYEHHNKQNNRSGNLHTATNKNYFEPL
jgi:hypothetical protein